MGLPGHRQDLCITQQRGESKDMFWPPDRSLPTDERPLKSEPRLPHQTGDSLRARACANPIKTMGS